MSFIKKLTSLLSKGKGVIKLSDDAVRVVPTVTKGAATMGTKVASFISNLPVVRLIAGSAVGVAVIDFYNKSVGIFDTMSENVADTLGIPVEAVQITAVAVFILLVISIIAAVRSRPDEEEEYGWQRF